jgi:hypothetical protein
MAREILSDYREAPTTKYRSAELLLLLRVCRTSRLRLGVQSAKYYKRQSARGLLNNAKGRHSVAEEEWSSYFLIWTFGRGHSGIGDSRIYRDQ